MPNRYDHHYDRRRVSHRDRDWENSHHQRWRVGDDVYLVETRNGLVVEVRYDAFH